MKLKAVKFILIMAIAAFSQSEPIIYPSQTMQIIAPKGGEVLSPGQTVDIRWTNDVQNTFIHIYLIIDNERIPNLVADVFDTAHSFSWVVPPIKQRNDNMAIHLERTFYVYDSISSGNFTIQAASPDSYEPNNDFASAYSVPLGDSVVKNAFSFDYMIDYSNLEIFPDTSKCDDDFYKVTLTGGMWVTASSIPWFAQGNGGYSNHVYGAPLIMLYDASKKWVSAGRGTVNYQVSQSGDYYLIIRGSLWAHYGLSIRQTSAIYTVVSPNGDEHYSAGQKVTISWLNECLDKRVDVYYSLGNGTPWHLLSSGINTSSCTWIVPHLKQGTNNAVIKVGSIFGPSPPDAIGVGDVSDGPFIVQASVPDVYEPNNNITGAYSVSIGDSVVKNATVFTNYIVSLDGVPNYSWEMDTGDFDRDLFKVELSAGKLAHISAFPWSVANGDSSEYGGRLPMITIFNASRPDSAFASERGSLNFTVPRSDVYYIKTEIPEEGWCTYGLSIHQSNGPTISLLSPNGGEIYSPGQEINIRWKKDAPLSAVNVLFSRDNGATWNYLESNLAGNDSFLLIAPYLKKRIDNALIKVVGTGITNPPYAVSGNLSIQAASPDAYEPNNAFETAYAIGVGDSVVKNAIAMKGDTAGIDTSTIDEDFYKIALTEGKLVNVSTFAHAWAAGTPGCFKMAGPLIEIYNIDGKLISWSSPSANFVVTKSGTYYCRIENYYINEWCKYGLSVKTMTILAAQKSSVEANALQKVGDAYKAQIIADTTKLNINLTLDKKVSGIVTTMVLSSDELAPPPDTKEKVKAISIAGESSLTSSIKTADIAIPYNTADLNGNPQTSLAILWLNDSTGKWSSISSTVDTVKHQIVAHTTHFSIYGVFVKSNTAIGDDPATAARVYGIKAKFLPQKRAVAVRCVFSRSQAIEMRIFNIQGKCIRRSTTWTEGSGNSSILWDLGALSNGRYILTIMAGAFRVQEAITILE